MSAPAGEDAGRPKLVAKTPRRPGYSRTLRALIVLATAGAAFVVAHRWSAHRCPLRDVNGDGRVVVLCFGDSITAGSIWGAYPQALSVLLGPSVQIVKAARFGETTEGGKRRLPAELENTHPDYVLVLEGMNDGCRAPTGIWLNLFIMASTIRAHNAIALIGTVYPPAETDAATHRCFENLNKGIAAMSAQARGVVVVDFAAAMEGARDQVLADGFHPNHVGYRILSETARDALLNASANLDVLHGS